MKKLFSILGITFLFKSLACAQYCIPAPPNGTLNGDYINHVILGTINNQTNGLPSVNSYVDYTSQSTNLTANATYNLSIRNGSYAYDTVAAWIDYNNDFDFNDPGEKLGQFGTSSAFTPDTIIFTVPSSVSNGVKRLRIRLAYQSFGIANMDACTDYEYGETEDYSVTIVGGGGSVPVAAFTANTTAIVAGGIVDFSDQSTNNPTSWLWNFPGGNPSSSTLMNPGNILYTTAGCFPVTLTATNALGSNSLTKTCYIGVSSVSSGCNELFFSEYLEGTGNNKALEIYNPTSSLVNLSNYAVEVYANGSSTVTASCILYGNIMPNDVYVIAHPSATSTILSEADTTHTICQFNGNDAIALTYNGNILDVIGEIGIDPGTSWTVGSGSTIDHTLVRNSGITEPSVSWSVGQNQWTSYPVGTTLYLGSHTSNCNTGIAWKDELFSQSNSCILPNPFHEQITINAEKSMLGQPFKIMDQTGRILIQGRLTLLSNNVHLINLTSGIYFLQVGSYTKNTIKLVKQ